MMRRNEALAIEDRRVCRWLFPRLLEKRGIVIYGNQRTRHTELAALSTFSVTAIAPSHGGSDGQRCRKPDPPITLAITNRSAATGYSRDQTKSARIARRTQCRCSPRGEREKSRGAKVWLTGHTQYPVAAAARLSASGARRAGRHAPGQRSASARARFPHAISGIARQCVATRIP